MHDRGMWIPYSYKKSFLQFISKAIRRLVTTALLLSEYERKLQF